MSDSTEYQVLERLSGTGTITGTGEPEPLQVRYEIVVREELNAPGSKHLAGKIWAASAEDPFMAHRLLSRPLTLHTTDGRLWNFVFIHRNGEIADSVKAASIG